MNLETIQGWLLGIDAADDVRIENVELGAAWAQDAGRFWVWFGAACLLAIAYIFYMKFQTRGSTTSRAILATCRGLLLVLVFLTLADPWIRLRSEHESPPLLYVLFDGTESMSIADSFAADDAAKLTKAVGLPDKGATELTRIDYIKALVARDDQDNIIRRLRDEKAATVKAFKFEGANTSQLSPLALAESGNEFQPAHLAAQISTSGQVTALGSVMDELSGQVGREQLAGVVIFSDYANNAGRAPVGESLDGRNSPLARLGVPVYTVGIGATEVVNLSLDVLPDPKMKRTERSNVKVKWTQTGLKGERVTIKVTGTWTESSSRSNTIHVGEETVDLNDTTGFISLPFTPEEAGKLEFTAEVVEGALEGEINAQDNTSRRIVQVIDDHLNFMYVAYEPDWEWRFIKEVFHRDRLVGIEGFRTYLRSADPKVRQHNELFLPTLTPKRSEFFANDIIFLGDMPRSALSDRFCELTNEFVRDFGGGLVVIAGPRFGPGELAGTPIADMLPVDVDPTARIRDQREFFLELTPLGQAEPFMRLGDGESDSENLTAWRNLGALPWYQPVQGPKADHICKVLAEHPVDVCADGSTKQPLIAVRKYGKGKVVYLGFNEMWRLRRKHGELFYRQFWSQVMNELALSNALGEAKRFDVRKDREKYAVDDRVTIMVEAFDENFERLKPERLIDGPMIADIYAPGSDDITQSIPLTMLTEGQYEARLRADVAGEWRVRVKDPIEDEYRELRFNVESLSAERRMAQRDAQLQRRIALASGGASYELPEIGQMVSDLELHPRKITNERIKSLWQTPLWFMLVVGLMLGEWFTRKMMNMS